MDRLSKGKKGNANWSKYIYIESLIVIMTSLTDAEGIFLSTIFSSRQEWNK